MILGSQLKELCHRVGGVELSLERISRCSVGGEWGGALLGGEAV